MALMSAHRLSTTSGCGVPADVPRLGYVRGRRSDAPGVWTLDIEMADGTPCDFAPGQFNMLTAFGVGDAAISISGAPGGECLVHTIRDVGPVSHALANLAPGDKIIWDSPPLSPYGNPELEEKKVAAPQNPNHRSGMGGR